MKKIVFLLAFPLLFSCTADDDSVVQEEVKLFVNHFKSTAVLAPTTVLLVQEDERRGSGEFSATLGIRGFEFEPGFTYDLTVVKTTTKNPGTDFSTVSYELISQNNKTEVALNESFAVPLAQVFNGAGYSSWITGTQEFGYFISREIPINCQLLCFRLEALLANQQEVTGVFIHGEDGEYILTDLY